VIGGDGDVFFFAAESEEGGTGEGRGNKKAMSHRGTPLRKNWRELTWRERNLRSAATYLINRKAIRKLFLQGLKDQLFLASPWGLKAPTS